jgi:TonB family protein
VVARLYEWSIQLFGARRGSGSEFFKLAAIVLVGQILLGGPQPSQATTDRAGRQSYFDVPAQPLVAALQQFMEISRVAVVVDNARLGDKRSSPLQGQFSVERGLRILLTGTGLYPRQIGDGAFTLDAMLRETTMQPMPRYPAYSAAIQKAVIDALCADNETRPTHYRVVLRLWLGASGVVERIGLDSSTGDRSLDAAIAHALQRIDIAAPVPAGLPQPVKLAILPRDGAEEAVCGPAVPAGEN